MLHMAQNEPALERGDLETSNLGEESWSAVGRGHRVDPAVLNADSISLAPAVRGPSERDCARFR